MPKSDYYLQNINGIVKKVFFTGKNIIDTAYYLQHPGNIRTMLTEIIPALETFNNIKFILPHVSYYYKRKMLLEYAELLNMTGITFLAPEDISEVQNLNELPANITYSKESIVNLRWLLKYRGLINTKYKFKKIAILGHEYADTQADLLISLKDRGFNIFIYNNIPIQHLIHLLAGAKHVVILHSAVVPYSIFCESNSKILDITGSDTSYNQKYIDGVSSLSPKFKLHYEKVYTGELSVMEKTIDEFIAT